MTNEVAKHHGKPALGKSKDMFYYIAATSAVILALVVVPKVFDALGVSFLAADAGLNKLFSVIVAVAVGWLCVKPAQGYRNFIDLTKGARTEWRKTVKPDRDTVVRTTMMVLILVFVFAILILILDSVIAMIVRAIV